MYMAHHEKIYQQMQNLKTDCYAGIDFGTHVQYFLGGIEEPSLKTAVQICESKDFHRVDFQACASYLTTMVQWTPAAKQVNFTATANKVDGVKLKNWDNTDQCLPLAKYSACVYKMLSPKQKEWLWQACKKANANGEDILAAKKRWGQTPPKQVKHLESAVVTQKHQLSSLTAQNQKMIVALTPSGIDASKSDPSSGKDDDGDHKIAANKKNSKLTKTNERRK